jgi:hypothetical protein
MPRSRNARANGASTSMDDVGTMPVIRGLHSSTLQLNLSHFGHEI